MNRTHLAGLAAVTLTALGVGVGTATVLGDDTAAPTGDPVAFCAAAADLPSLGEGVGAAFAELVELAPSTEIRHQAEGVHEIAVGMENGDEEIWFRLFVDPELAELDKDWAQTLEGTCGIVDENRIPIADMQAESTGTLTIGDAEFEVG